MEALREWLQRRQAAYVVAAIAIFLVLCYAPWPPFPSYAVRFVTIALYSIAAGLGWWWINSVDGRGLDERLRSIYFGSATVALYVFFLGVLAIALWRGVHGQPDDTILTWVTCCTILFVLVGALRSARS